MVFVLFIASGLKSSPEQHIGGLGVNANVWRKGEAMRGGRIREDFGFSVSMPDAANWAEAMPAIRSFMQLAAAPLLEFSGGGGEFELSVGVTVGKVSSFAPTLEFPFEFLEELVASRVQLSISAYPTSSET